MGTNGPQTGTTPSSTSDFDDVDPTRTSVVAVELDVEKPRTGSFAGAVEVVLLEKDVAGAVAERVVHTATAPGEVDLTLQVSEASAVGTSFKWSATTRYFSIRVRIVGATKNCTVRIRKKIRKRRKWFWKRRRPKHRPGRRKPPPTLPRDDTAIEPPPEPPETTETFPIPHPDRPLVGGVQRGGLDFEAGLPGAPWRQVTAGGATLAVDTVAALTGTQGLRSLKSAAGTVEARAYLAQSFSARQGDGFSALTRLPVWPADGRIGLTALARPSDDHAFAWPEATAAAEVSEVEITDDATKAGNVTVILDGVAHYATAGAVK